MLNNKGFDLWAKEYDKSVDLSYEEKTYPFISYKEILNEIYNRVLKSKGRKILDIGFGTGTLTSSLYDKGFDVYGQDFSEEMVKISREKMQKAKLYLEDFTNGLVDDLMNQKYDVIIATYSLHHLSDEKKIAFIKSLLSLLNVGGRIYIGDIAFQTRKDLEACKIKEREYWDNEEIYFVYEELKIRLPNLSFEKFSYCSGLLTISN